jgi:glyoxylase-like metal-dependent hydrolase (beta-lactamase superfamily II)
MMIDSLMATREWTHPGATKVAQGLYRLPLPIPNDGLHAVNVYIHVENEGFSLIDSGWSSQEAWAQLEDALNGLGGTMRDVRKVLVTHGHRDHYTLAMRIRDESGAKVFLGAGERPLIDAVRAGWGRGLEMHIDRLNAAGAHDVVRDLREFLKNPPDYARADDRYDHPDIWLADGDTVEVAGRQLTAVSTPGHTVGHVVYADLGREMLFGGDHLLPHITPSIGFEPAPRPDPLGAFITSQQRMLDLPDLRLLPAHGPLAVSSRTRAQQLLDHHDERLEQTLRALDAGKSTAYEVAGQLSWTRHLRRLSDLDLFNRLLAINETRFHLDELVARGFVDGEPKVRGVRMFTARL